MKLVLGLKETHYLPPTGCSVEKARQFVVKVGNIDRDLKVTGYTTGIQRKFCFVIETEFLCVAPASLKLTM